MHVIVIIILVTMDRFQFNIIRAASFWVLAWASVCLAVIKFTAQSEDENSGSVLFLVGSPFVVAASYLAVYDLYVV